MKSKPELGSRLLLAGTALAWIVWAGVAGAQLAGVTVDTLGGGPRQGNLSAAGNADGNTYSESQFNGPVAVAVDSDGTLYVADRSNGKVRKVTLPGDQASGQTTTWLGGLSSPASVVCDSLNNLYVLTQGDGRIQRFNKYGNLLALITSSMAGGNALAVDMAGNCFVTVPGSGAAGGVVRKITSAGVVTTVATGLNQPQGIALMANGLLAVSEAGKNRLCFIHPKGGTNVLVVGGPNAGYSDGLAEFARFNMPVGLASSPSGTLVVADKLNHRFRLVETNGLTTTLYGIDPANWGPDHPPGSYAGWYDASGVFAEAREPLSAVVDAAGKIFTTEGYYHLLRVVTGAPLGAGGSSGTNGTGTNVVVIPPPSFAPNTGYYPMGQIISVASSYPVYYTTDGSDPTTNSSRMEFDDANTGTIVWNEPLRDLASLRLMAVYGTNASVVVGGQAVAANELGVPGDLVAGSGSTVLVPLVMNLRPNQMARTLQYRVEITPVGTAPALRPQFNAVSISTNDFVTVAGSSLPGTVAEYLTQPYPIVNPTNGSGSIPGGLAVFVIGTNANFMIQGFGTAAMLLVPVHPAAREGDRYVVNVTNISATSDGQDADLLIRAMPPRTLTISNLTYVVGDSARSRWYAAGTFGDGDLRNNDVNNAFYASLGIRTPPSYTDVFDSMDAFPPDAVDVVGGDGEIRYLDWQLILQRSLRLDVNNYARHWGTNGHRVSQTTALQQTKAVSPKSSIGSAPGSVWDRQATVFAGTVANAQPGSTTMVPIYVSVASSNVLAGLSMRLVVQGENDAPPVQLLSFTPASGRPRPTVASGLTASELLLGWSMVASSGFQPALTGSSNLLGFLGVRLSSTAQPGHSYMVRFLAVDGAASLQAQCDLDGLAGSLWVQTAAQRAPEMTSERWRTNFFGFLGNPLAGDWVDADGDGVPNCREYLAGTNPTNAASRLELRHAAWTTAPTPGFEVTWLSAPSKSYVIERCDRVDGTQWTPVASGLVGDGQMQSYLDTSAPGGRQFYRVRVQP
jgi:hypothetical protein